jgi:2-succinyl-6-hydroxy-2,4-cyclohexadiene-1-carboxylate synthase
MKLIVDGIQFNILLNESDLNKKKTPIVFLHGFTGRAANWEFIFDKLPPNFSPIAIDLIGHGETDSPHNLKYYSCTGIVQQLDSIFSQLNLNNFIITGYSMGGRAALAYSIRCPQRVRAAIFESTTPGLEDITAQKERVEIDLLLAEKINREGIESFINFWFDTPLFRSLIRMPNFLEEKNKRLKNNPIGLINILSGFSTGLMKSCWSKLPELKIPVLLITGELDEKYTMINQAIKLKVHQAQHTIIPACSHNVHLEKPELFTKLVSEFLNSL